MTQDDLKLVLDALKWCHGGEPCGTAQAIAVVEKALAQPKQEPVAWADIQKEAQQIVESKFLWKKFIDGTPLSNDIACWMADFAQQYTASPQRTWAGLTDDEMEATFLECGGKWNGDFWKIEDADFHPFLRTIEAKLKEKNT